MSSPRHSPPPSAAAPKPRGILKNAHNGVPSSEEFLQQQEQQSISNDDQQAQAQAQAQNGPHLAWDEGNLILHEMEREQQDPRMKIDEPKTPFVRSASLGPMMDDDPNFDLLDNNNQLQQQQPSSSQHFAESSSSSAASVTGQPYNVARRSSAAEVLAANTKANAGGAVSQPGVSVAVGLDSVDLNNINPSTISNTRSRDSTPSSSRRGTESRSPSFTLPNSRRSSAAGGEQRSREGVRKELSENRMDVEGDDQQEGAFDDEDDEEQSEEVKAKQDAFARKRNAHYGNEAEAMRIAAALAKDDEDDEDDEDEDSQGVPPLPNGRA